MRISLISKLTLTALGLASLGLLLLAPAKAIASNPSTINFQGKIVNSNGTNVTDGTYSIVFRIYNTSSPTMTTSCTSTATCLWQETQGSVSVTSGVFQVELGSSCALTSNSCNNSSGGPINFANNSALYLTMQFNGDTSGSNGGFMFPLIHMNSVPFALQADNASSLGGISSGNFVQLAQGVQSVTSNTNPLIFLKQSGSANLLELQGSSSDVFVVGNTGATTITNTSSSAFKVQGAASVLAVDTTDSLINAQGINSTATFGSELLNQTPPNNNFVSGTYWTLGTGWGSASTTQVTATNATGTLTTTSSDLTVATGKIYQVVFTVGTYSGSGCLTPSIGGASGNPVCGNSSGETQIIGQTTTTGQLTFTPSGNFSGIVSNVSVKQLTQTANAVLDVNNSDGSVGVEIRSGGSGDQNTYIGLGSGDTNTSGSGNTALGLDSLNSNTTGSENVAVGAESLALNTTGGFNTAIGVFAQNVNTTGTFNTSTGYESLTSNTTGSGNSAFGNLSLENSISGNNNSAVGFDAGRSITSGSNDTFLGSFAGYQDPNATNFTTLTNLQNATAIGYGSQVQENNAIVLGSVGTTASNLTPNIGIGTTSPTNLFSVSPDIYDTGTACQGANSSCNTNGTFIWGTGTTWTSNMVGDEIVFADGTKYTITAFNSTTELTVGTSATKGGSNSYRIQNPAFFVSSTGTAQFRDSTNSTTAFQVQSNSGSALLTADTTNGLVLIGSNVQSNSNLVLFQLNSDSDYNSDEGTCSTSGSGTNLGAMYYNTATQAIRACINGGWEDIVSTAALGLQLFGVVPDSGTTPGDLIGIAGQGTGPCKVYMGSTTATIRWTGCIAYSGGRKVVVAAQSTNQSVTLTNGHWEHVCLSGTAGAVQVTDSTSETANLGTVSFPSATSPIVCLADLTVNGSAITAIYDTRTFTTTTKEFVNDVTTAVGLGQIVQQTTTAGQVTKAAATAELAELKGVVVASAGTTTANTINAIIATNGPAYVKSSAGSAQGIIEQGGTTAGYAITTTTQTTTANNADLYSYLGIAESSRVATCSTTADNCRTSLFVNLSIR